MTPRSRYSAWRYPAFWPKKAIIPFVFFGLLLASIPHAGQFSLRNNLNFQKENNHAFAQAILTAKLASVPSYVWLRRLNCELQPRPGCTPAKLFFSEGQSLHSDLSIRVEKSVRSATLTAQILLFLGFKASIPWSLFQIPRLITVVLDFFSCQYFCSLGSCSLRERKIWFMAVFFIARSI